ncbi:hypothetical protein BDP27DRAFT_1312651 [Rhodocollybia butyracea]|uniref:Amidohydrolase-related domain-containing protein n=1 Tax=Rhodocollybia butyracea TaxID=206335 RepID=A0A9P5QAJ0_9AGAR|nr:hypothetical protein BDP27DRAFT_1312651 [Rhodocollybia butyracea]
MPEKTYAPLSDLSTPPALSLARKTVTVLFFLAISLALWWSYDVVSVGSTPARVYTYVPASASAQEILRRCNSFNARPDPSVLASLGPKRTISDRYDPGKQNMSYLITNATIFTGMKNEDGSVKIITGSDLLMTNGLIRAIGRDVPRDLLSVIDSRKLSVIRANGSWVTPGLVDVNSQLGVFSSPPLRASNDFDSKKGPILPWLRSIDGLHTRDNNFELAMAAGTTSAQILPGSSNSIGGEAFVVKLRRTAEGSAVSMIVDPPHGLNSTRGKGLDQEEPMRWRHLMQSCSEKTRRYGNRMDMMWSLRSAYHEARLVMQAQDAFCAKAETGIWDDSRAQVPDDFQWDLLLDVLRGKVKVTSDCSEAIDLDNMIRLSNEFGFPLDIFLHASEAYLVPALVNGSDAGTPAIALLSTGYHHSRESYRGSEFAPAILASRNFSVIMTTDGLIVNSRQLIDEARKAYHFGLSEDLALASVTSAPAKALGLGYRIGVLEEGYDADVVMWDSHPLQLGASPVHVWIDGMRQIPLIKESGRSTYSSGTISGVEESVDPDETRQNAPGQPSYEKETRETLNWDGLPPLMGLPEESRVVFRNVKEVWKKGRDKIEESFLADKETLGTVIVENGKITCVGTSEDCALVPSNERTVDIDLQGGSISPGLLTFGSPVGLEEIDSESSTSDGDLLDALSVNIPNIFNDVGGMIRAFDALVFDTRHARMAYRFGVTTATSSLSKPHQLYKNDDRMIWGLSTTFRTAASHVLEPGATIQTDTALHVRITRPRFDLNGPPAVSVSSQLAALRRLLYGWESRDTDTGLWFRKAAEGVIPLIVEVESADIMASLILLRHEVDGKIGGQMRMVFIGATESWLLAKEIGQARIGVILTSLKPVATKWDERRILPGPPLTNQTALGMLLDAGVSVGIGVQHPQAVMETRFQLSQVLHEIGASLSPREVYGLATTNLEKILGVKGIEPESADLVAFAGGSAFNLSSKVVAVISPQRGLVDLL